MKNNLELLIESEKLALSHMSTSEIFSYWMNIELKELKDALKPYVSEVMGSKAGYCLK